MDFKDTNKKIVNPPKLQKTLVESTSSGCSPKQVNFYRRMYNTNPEIKTRHRKVIDLILKDIFSDYWRSNKKGQVEGIYDYERPGRSILNKINTNYSCFCILVNDINIYLKKYGLDIINFHNRTPEEQINEYGKLSKHLMSLKNRIFNSDSATFSNIVSTLDKTNKFGDDREVESVETLKKIFNTNKVFKVGELGNTDDMLGGIDAYVELDGKKKTIQIKPFGERQQNGNNVILYGTGNVKKYKTDYMVFHNKNIGTLVFNNTNTYIVDGRYVFHIKNQINDLGTS